MMKNCDEMVNSLLERRDRYDAEKKRKRTIIVRSAVPVCCVCLAALLGFCMWKSELLKIPQQEQTLENSEKTQSTGEIEMTAEQQMIDYNDVPELLYGDVYPVVRYAVPSDYERNTMFLASYENGPSYECVLQFVKDMTVRDPHFFAGEVLIDASFRPFHFQNSEKYDRTEKYFFPVVSKGRWVQLLTVAACDNGEIGISSILRNDDLLVTDPEYDMFGCLEALGAQSSRECPMYFTGSCVLMDRTVYEFIHPFTLFPEGTAPELATEDLKIHVAEIPLY